MQALEITNIYEFSRVYIGLLIFNQYDPGLLEYDFANISIFTLSSNSMH